MKINGLIPHVSLLPKLLIQLEILCCESEKGMISILIIDENKPFKDREDVKTEIRNCNMFGSISQYACFASLR